MNILPREKKKKNGEKARGTKMEALVWMNGACLGKVGCISSKHGACFGDGELKEDGTAGPKAWTNIDLGAKMAWV